MFKVLAILKLCYNQNAFRLPCNSTLQITSQSAPPMLWSTLILLQVFSHAALNTLGNWEHWLPLVPASIWCLISETSPLLCSVWCGFSAVTIYTVVLFNLINVNSTKYYRKINYEWKNERMKEWKYEWIYFEMWELYLGSLWLQENNEFWDSFKFI